MQSWRTNRAQAYQGYLDDLLDYHEQEAEGTLDADAKEPVWREWHIPTLSQTCIQANANVVVLEPAQDSTFDYWLTISTLAFRQQLRLPVKLAAYHRETLKGKTTAEAEELFSKFHDLVTGHGAGREEVLSDEVKHETDRMTNDQ